MLQSQLYHMIKILWGKYLQEGVNSVIQANKESEAVLIALGDKVPFHPPSFQHTMVEA